ncbi:MAG TPA: hypothetical protein DEE98_02170 [Elusimicrobia bacterium]|nr:MAG: hypothetical protein A2278_08290 [Elusimicrobia bacterium RIFOXYA12_FULL_49_49]OGS09840.1 MAG: hypothetical protein A2204_07280 [Elusimicrobia bacterium RIFOXYA1_FULL_47_7]OGS15936.1 MAG: hypothetical protein A2251_01975 [Elusimicrobia bacterium RIFOXYA2_FULL_47_53]OGS26382.1 MAG: hypothetical protein A2339_03295 [Elusimicrobia bacterium RIFOXYB12_FULL_50_12]OGS29104.1 MAG: hypothetical protein A2323_04515 [Elusimicrobia bacterium RIFOXYB2_FULL_46_23]HBU69168.1 hypothetical protein [El
MKKKDFAVIFSFLAFVLALFAPQLLENKTFFLRDLTYLFHPWKSLCAESIQRGELPLWNPYSSCGTPLMANWQSAVFYPFSILFYIFPFAKALNIFNIIHVFAAGIFAYLFGKKYLGQVWQPAWLMVMSAFNGYFISRLEFVSHAATDIWLFIMLLFVTNPALLAITAAFAFLAGHQVFLIHFSVVMAFAVFYDAKSFFSLRTISKLSLFLTIFLPLIMAQLAPTFELSRLSARVKSGIDYASAVKNSLAFSDLPRIISPVFSPSYAAIDGEKFPWALTFHLGFTAAFGALAVFFLSAGRKINIIPGTPKPSRIIVFSVFIFTAGIFIALGSNQPVYRILYDHIAFFRSFRYPSQFILLSVTGLALFSSFAARRFRFGGILVLIAAAELLVTNYNFSASAPGVFFYEKSQIQSFLQRDIANNRFILSPGTEQNRLLSGKTLSDAWSGARGALYGMTAIPYHISNAYGAGEPLTLSSVERTVNAAYKQDSPQEARKYYELLGVKYLIARSELPDTPGYEKVLDAPFKVYRLSGNTSLISSADDRALITVENVRFSKYRIEVKTASDSPLIIKQSFYPGWEYYVDGIKTAASEYKGIFRQIELTGGRHIVYQIYRPGTFNYSLILSSVSILLLAIFGIMKLHGLLTRVFSFSSAERNPPKHSPALK